MSENKIKKGCGTCIFKATELSDQCESCDDSRSSYKADLITEIKNIVLVQTNAFGQLGKDVGIIKRRLDKIEKGFCSDCMYAPKKEIKC